MITEPAESNQPLDSIAFIGAGNMARALSRLAVASGMHVSFSNSRGPHTLPGWVDDLGADARAESIQDSVASAQVVVLAIPFGSFDQLPGDIAEGKLLLDMTNYYPGMYAARPSLDDGSMTSSELIQAHFRGSRVAKAFNTIAAHHITNLSSAEAVPSGRNAIPVAVDDGQTLRQAETVLNGLGFDALFVGTLQDSWRIEPGTPAFVTPYLSRPGADWTRDPGRASTTKDLDLYVQRARR